MIREVQWEVWFGEDLGRVELGGVSLTAQGDLLSGLDVSVGDNIQRQSLGGISDNAT